MLRARWCASARGCAGSQPPFPGAAAQARGRGGTRLTSRGPLAEPQSAGSRREAARARAGGGMTMSVAGPCCGALGGTEAWVGGCGCGRGRPGVRAGARAFARGMHAPPAMRIWAVRAPAHRHTRRRSIPNPNPRWLSKCRGLWRTNSKVTGIWGPVQRYKGTLCVLSARHPKPLQQCSRPHQMAPRNWLDAPHGDEGEPETEDGCGACAYPFPKQLLPYRNEWEVRNLLQVCTPTACCKRRTRTPSRGEAARCHPPALGTPARAQRQHAVRG